MNFYRLPGSLEYIFGAIFIGFYLLYFVKTSYLAYTLKSGFGRLFFKLVIRTLYFSLFLIALLAPSFGDIKKEIKSVGKDIYIVIDLSKSMDANDIAPTRIQKIKYELNNIIEAFSSDRIGLIIFSNEAFVQCPITFDKSALSLFIETISTNLLLEGGTDFGKAILLASEKFDTDKDKKSKDNSKIIVLVSDGEDFGDQTSDAISEVKSQNIKLFTLGIGTEKGSRIPIEKGDLKDEDGKVVYSKLNNSSLQTLASKTNGKYYEINESQNQVPNLIRDIGLIQGELLATKEIDSQANKYYYFLFIALILMVFDILLTVKTFKI